MPDELKAFGVCNNLPIKEIREGRDYRTNNEGALYSTSLRRYGDELHNAKDPDYQPPPEG